eukprot:tig00020598_g11709.t2
MEQECGSPHAGDDRTKRVAQDDEGGGAAERDMEGNSTAGALAAQSVIDLDSADETMESRKTTSEAPALSGDAEGDGAPAVIDLDSAEGAKDTGGTARAAATANNPAEGDSQTASAPAEGDIAGLDGGACTLGGSDSGSAGVKELTSDGSRCDVTIGPGPGSSDQGDIAGSGGVPGVIGGSNAGAADGMRLSEKSPRRHSTDGRAVQPKVEPADAMRTTRSNVPAPPNMSRRPDEVKQERTSSPPQARTTRSNVPAPPNLWRRPDEVKQERASSPPQTTVRSSGMASSRGTGKGKEAGEVAGVPPVATSKGKSRDIDSQPGGPGNQREGSKGAESTDAGKGTEASRGSSGKARKKQAPFICDNCGITFKGKGTHIDACKRKSASEATSKKADDDRLPCPAANCNRTYASKKTLSNHMKTCPKYNAETSSEGETDGEDAYEDEEAYESAGSVIEESSSAAKKDGGPSANTRNSKKAKVSSEGARTERVRPEADANAPVHAASDSVDDDNTGNMGAQPPGTVGPDSATVMTWTPPTVLAYIRQFVTLPDGSPELQCMQELPLTGPELLLYPMKMFRGRLVEICKGAGIGVPGRLDLILYLIDCRVAVLAEEAIRRSADENVANVIRQRYDESVMQGRWRPG